jgi:glycosyltransferase involved in cell wall biosynthesis
VPESKIKFLPNGIDMNVFHPANDRSEIASLRKKFSLPTGKSIVLFVGRFVPKKGFTKLMDLQPVHNSVFAFAGGDAPGGDKRADHIFLGKISRDDIPSLYRAADTFVLPSSGEGFPMTIMEAMASGLSVITTRDPAYDLYKLSDQEISLIDPTVANLQSVIENSRPSKTGEFARSYATKNFSLDVHAKRLISLYKEIIR